jgi:hypothetical protein
MSKEHNEEYFRAILKECEDTCYKKAPGIKSTHRQAFTEACEGFHEAFEQAKVAESEEDSKKAAKGQEKAMKKCVKAATKIFEKLDVTETSCEKYMMKGCIIVRATPAGLAEFCSRDKKNTKMIDHLFKETALMRDMLINGGAKDGNYGASMKIYTDILATFPDVDDEFTPVNKKIALAVALELATPMWEFDTKVEVNPVERYLHYRDAFQAGELDPAFPHFSVWELRHVVNSDAKNDQLKWGRYMLMNYAPYISVVTDPSMQYTYILETDVLIRNPSWTGDPRTYQMVLSGGGKDIVNAWFGRFICKAFGIPCWGCDQGGKHGYTRWTKHGWVTGMGMAWDECEWNETTGTDFKGETDARAAVPEEEYYQKFILLECLAEVMDSRRGDIPDEERTILHPLRLWRSLSIVQKALMLEPSAPENFKREGESLVKTNQEKYMDMFTLDEPDDHIKVKKDKVVVPMGSAHTLFGNVMKIACFKGGQQLNFVGPGHCDFDLPDDLEHRTYKLTLEVNTVHRKQTTTTVVANNGEPVSIAIPYTLGIWQKTNPVEIELRGGQVLTFAREKGNLGIAVRKIYLE